LSDQRWLSVILIWHLSDSTCIKYVFQDNLEAVVALEDEEDAAGVVDEAEVAHRGVGALVARLLLIYIRKADLLQVVLVDEVGPVEVLGEVLLVEGAENPLGEEERAVQTSYVISLVLMTCCSCPLATDPGTTST
jgi:hypothetical protein